MFSQTECVFLHDFQTYDGVSGESIFDFGHGCRLRFRPVHLILVRGDPFFVVVEIDSKGVILFQFVLEQFKC